MSTSDLFETPPFLEQKLGLIFFNDIPQEPGIYRFYDENDILLYVGKAKNLRRRLFTYKRARPGRTSRKGAALISKISRFEYDVLASEEEAILKENQWIREFRPEFNHANKHIETYYFITIQRTTAGLIFGLSMNSSGVLFPENEKPLYREMDSLFFEISETKIYGCFKGHRPVRTSFGALLQLLWMAEHQAISPHFLPVQLSRNLAPLRFRINFKNQQLYNTHDLMSFLDEWFLGISPDLIHFLNESISDLDDSGFARSFIDGNMDLLLTYFHTNLVRHQLMRQYRTNRESHLIRQDELDDLITKLNGR